jgi:cation-transporting ATPase 13A2
MVSGISLGSDAIWSGEAGYSVPSSITSMHFMHQARRPSIALRRSSSRARMSYGEERRYSTDRRYSRDVSRSRRNSGNYSEYADERDQYEDRPRILRNDSRKSRRSVAVSDGDAEWDESPVEMDDVVPPSPGLLPRIASALGFHQHKDDEMDEETGIRRRSSRGSHRPGSRRTSASSHRRSTSSARSRDSEISEESWGYSSNERDTYSEISERGDRDDDDQSFRSSLADDTSLPPQSRPSSPIPLLPTDGIFGDPSAPNDLPSIQLFTDIASGSKQTISLPDEDLSIRFTGYVTAKFKSLLWMIGCIVTLGGLGLIGRWVPSIWVKWCGKEKDFERSGKDGWLVVETPYGDLHIIQQDVVPYPYPLSTVFPQATTGKAIHSRPPTVASTVGSRAPSIMAAAVARSHAPNGTDEPNGVPASTGGAKDLMTIDLEQGQTAFEETMGFLKTAEYRYTKFALQPGTGRWCLVRDWRDPKWTSVKAVASGLNKDVREQRRILFGDNVIDIEGKGVVGLLLDEVSRDSLTSKRCTNAHPRHR